VLIVPDDGCLTFETYVLRVPDVMSSVTRMMTFLPLTFHCSNES